MTMNGMKGLRPEAKGLEISPFAKNDQETARIYKNSLKKDSRFDSTGTVCTTQMLRTGPPFFAEGRKLEYFFFPSLFSAGGCEGTSDGLTHVKEWPTEGKKGGEKKATGGRRETSN